MKCEPLVLLRQTNVHALEIHVIGKNRIPRTRNMTIKISDPEYDIQNITDPE